MIDMNSLCRRVSQLITYTFWTWQSVAKYFIKSFKKGRYMSQIRYALPFLILGPQLKR